MASRPVKLDHPATYRDLLDVPEHLVAEILEGKLYTSPRPAFPNAYTAGRIHSDLEPFQGPSGRGLGPGGWWILFEPELHLGREVAVPDLAGWRIERLPHFPRSAFLELVPDWVCEIASPGSVHIDRVRKMDLYAREGNNILDTPSVPAYIGGMERNAKAPETLLEAIRYFADADTCLRFMVGLRWANGIVCPRCNADGPSFLSTRRIWKCKGCKKQFSVKVGTIFEDSPLGLDKWLPALWMIANCKNGISSYELARALDVTQKTAWFMLHRIRLAMQCESFGKFGGSVEVDETFIGGKARFMHKAERARKITGTGGAGKVAVMGLLERHGSDGHSRVRLAVLKSTKKAELQGHVRANVAVGSEVSSDALKSYDGLSAEFIHGVVDHAERATSRARSTPTAWRISGAC